MTLLYVIFLQAVPEVPNSVVAIIGVLATMITGTVGLVMRSYFIQMSKTADAWQKQVAEDRAAEIVLRKQDALDRVTESRANRAVLTQLLSFMAALNENMRTISQTWVPRDPIPVTIEQPPDRPVPTVPAGEAKS